MSPNRKHMGDGHKANKSPRMHWNKYDDRINERDLNRSFNPMKTMRRKWRRDAREMMYIMNVSEGPGILMKPAMAEIEKNIMPIKRNEDTHWYPPERILVPVIIDR